MTRWKAPATGAFFFAFVILLAFLWEVTPADSLGSGVVDYDRLLRLLPARPLTIGLSVETSWSEAYPTPRRLERLVRALWQAEGGAEAPLQRLTGRFAESARIAQDGLVVEAEAVRLRPVAPDGLWLVVDEARPVPRKVDVEAWIDRLFEPLPRQASPRTLAMWVVGELRADTPPSCRQWTDRLLRRWDFTPRLRLSERRLCFVAGETEGLGPSILFGGERVNLSLLVAYDSERHAAQVVLATPIVSTTFRPGLGWP